MVIERCLITKIGDRWQEVHLAECAINNEADSIGDPQEDPDDVLLTAICFSFGVLNLGRFSPHTFDFFYLLLIF